MIPAIMWEDPIVEEVRRVRERLFAECDYDLDKWFEKMREHSARAGRELVSYPPRPVDPRDLGLPPFGETTS